MTPQQVQELFDRLKTILGDHFSPVISFEPCAWFEDMPEYNGYWFHIMMEGKTVYGIAVWWSVSSLHVELTPNSWNMIMPVVKKDLDSI